jgi:hypothetical protein
MTCWIWTPVRVSTFGSFDGCSRAVASSRAPRFPRASSPCDLSPKQSEFVLAPGRTSGSVLESIANGQDRKHNEDVQRQAHHDQPRARYGLRTIRTRLGESPSCSRGASRTRSRSRDLPPRDRAAGFVVSHARAELSLLLEASVVESEALERYASLRRWRAEDELAVITCRLEAAYLGKELRR